MFKKLIYCSVAILLLFQFNCYASSHVSRAEIPTWLVGTWFGVNVGYISLPFTNADLEADFTARHIETPVFVVHGEIGHYFNRYLGAEFGLLRTLGDAKYIGVARVDDYHNVMTSFFSLALRPTLPLSRQFWLYSEAGVGYVSRNGFTVNNVVAVKNNGVFSPLIGAGLSYRVSRGVFIDLKLRYMFANNSMKQPSLFFAGLGFYYLLTHEKAKPPASPVKYMFPHNFIQLNYFNRDILDADASKYFSPPYLPIFFRGAINVKDALLFMYQRNFFHTQKNFSLAWGVSGGRFSSRELKQKFYTVSIFPELKIWMVRCPRFDLYFTYSLAGPTYISRHIIDGIDSGGNFTFQDFLGLGALVGRSKHVSVSLKIVHYSSGNLYSHNPGVKIPVMFALAYAW